MTDDRAIIIEIRRGSVMVSHRHSIDDVAQMVHDLAEHFEYDEDLLIILDCAIKLYRRNNSTKEKGEIYD